MGLSLRLGSIINIAPQFQMAHLHRRASFDRQCRLATDQLPACFQDRNFRAAAPVCRAATVDRYRQSQWCRSPTAKAAHRHWRNSLRKSPAPRMAVCTDRLKSGRLETVNSAFPCVSPGAKFDRAAELPASFDQFEHDRAASFFHGQFAIQRQIAYPMWLSGRITGTTERFTVVIGVIVVYRTVSSSFRLAVGFGSRNNVLIANPCRLLRRIRRT